MVDSADQDEPADVNRSKLSIADLLSEITLSLTARPARTLLTALGTILGVAALVATLGLARTAGNQILTRFDELAATEVTVEPEQSFFGFGNQPTLSVIPFDSEDRLIRLNGVVAVGTISEVDTAGALASSVPVDDPLGQNEFQVPLLAVSPGLFDAARAQEGAVVIGIATFLVIVYMIANLLVDVLYGVLDPRIRYE